MKYRSWLIGMVVVLLIATALRIYAFGQVPPGLYHDEAQHGLDAVDVLEGRGVPIYFAANNGREPLMVYLDVLAVGVLGRSPVALRIPAFFAGVLTVAATGAMGRVLFSRRAGLLAAGVLAITLWHVHLSRTAFRAVLLPLFIALTIWQVGQGIRTGKRKHWMVAGLLYGLSFYTYTAARFTPVALAAIGFYVVLVQRKAGVRLPWRALGLGLAAAFVVLAPLAVYTLSHSGIVLGRPGQVSITNPGINGGDFWGTLGTHTLQTLGMFFVKGDRIWRHNLPLRPIFDPVLGLMFLVGLWVLFSRAAKAPAAGLVIIWTVVMALPTLLAEDAPHFLRAVGVLPVVVLFPALGMEWLLRHTNARWLRYAVVAVPLLFGLGSTAWDYFEEYGKAPTAGYWFEQGAVTLAGRINSFQGTGWDGSRMLHMPAHDRQVFLDTRLWQDWPQVRFLVADPSSVSVGLVGEPHSSSVAVFTWPYEDWQRAWGLLPTPAGITVEKGPLSQGDTDSTPYTTYVAFYAVPALSSEPTVVHFSGGIELLGAAVDSVAQGVVRVRLRWQAQSKLEKDYTIFVHYLRDGEEVAQADSQAASGYYPTSQWHVGDVINDDHNVTGVGAPIPGRDSLVVGLWLPESGNVLYLLDDSGNPVADWLEVDVR